LQRNRLFALFAGLASPPIDRSRIPTCRKRRFLPVRPEEHVGRHARSPGFHRLAKRAHTPAPQMRGDGEPVRARADDCYVEAVSHARDPLAVAGTQRVGKA
jgi:hypothetical protein